MEYSAFSLLNTIILSSYLIGMLIIGFFFSKKISNSEQFFLGGRNLPWIAVAMSMYASLTSAVTFMGLPVIAYDENIALIAVCLSSILVAPIILKLFYSKYHKYRIITSYQYILKRFGPKAQKSVASLFVLSRVGWLGTVIYAPALALSAATGYSLEICILLIGCIATIYTTLGGIVAVVWTDIIQFIILISGAIWICISLVENTPGGLQLIVDNASNANKFDIFTWDINWMKLSFPVVAISFFLQLMQEYGTDQVTVQRMMATGSQKKTIKAISFNAVTDLITISLLLFIGLGLFSFYDSYTLPDHIISDNLMVYFIITELPDGISGLIITAIFAAAMSSLDSGINSLTAVILNDFKKSNQRTILHARFLTIILGIIATITAFYVSNIGGLIKAFASFMGLFSAPVLALFLIGVLTKNGNLKGWLIGLLVSIPFTLWLQYGLQSHWIYFFPGSFLVAFIMGITSSKFFKSGE